MPIAFWRDEYITGEQEIDTQHQILFSIINELHDAMISGEGREILGKTLDKLATYTSEHFVTEEALMEKYEYPNIVLHKQKHRELREDVLTLQKLFKEKEKFLTVKVSQFMTDWLIHHIKGEDLKMINFIKENRNYHQKFPTDK
ncbi:bacteriohemerythrin [Geminocystis herdmanii]|uniref:bacteriohemerythrin n=1 Tax=Geminocystis herdmanii TaxID=669359 RepID=UPI000349AC8C|nr:bacteriohemerythrin [Geminocystis herdmanii]